MFSLNETLIVAFSPTLMSDASTTKTGSTGKLSSTVLSLSSTKLTASFPSNSLAYNMLLVTVLFAVDLRSTA